MAMEGILPEVRYLTVTWPYPILHDSWPVAFDLEHTNWQNKRSVLVLG